MTDRVDTSLFAPQARLVDLDSGVVLGVTGRASAGESTTGDASAILAPDIIGVTVTLTNTGVGQLEVTLNNQRVVDGKPVFPPWKYNDFSAARPRVEAASGLGGIRFGQLLRLDMRYGAGTWNKMITAHVTDLTFTFSGAGAQLRIVGEDVLSLLKAKPTADQTYERRFEEDIVQEVLNAVFTDASRRPTFSPTSEARTREGRTEPIRSLRHSRSVTYFQFLQEMAQRLDYEIYVRYANVASEGARADQVAGSEQDLSSELVFCFEPARSGNAPPRARQDSLAQAGADFHYELRWGRDVVEFRPRFKVFEMPTRAEAVGTSPGRRGRSTQRLSQGDIDGLFAAELPLSPNYAELSMQGALQARALYFTSSAEENTHSESGSNLDAPRLRLKARAAFAHRVREFLTADGEIIGVPGLRPGVYVDIAGMRPPFDGYYYVTKTEHTLDGAGYRTKFALRRPGMLPPDHYLPPAPTPTREAVSA